ncbi:aminodeoxychorismate synthase component I [Castellaniella hirudinis]|uniref:aminodeoxychorismate synthase component I n=1 Tax=Castellaniella hirudinis TaxID=1144617 RepID=UPI0039C161B6
MSPALETPCAVQDAAGARQDHRRPAACRFDDALSGWSLRLDQPAERIAVHRQADLPDAWAAIAQAGRQGHWVALLLDYELGDWLNDPPAAPRPTQPIEPQPRLTALVFRQASEQGQRPDPRRRIAHAARPSPADPDDTHWAIHDAQASQTLAQYRLAIAAIRQGIARGDYYQINHTIALQLDWPAALPPDQAYHALIRQHPVAHGAFIQDGARQVLSLSPELFVARRGNTLYTRPMKGTAPRHTDPIQDRAAGQALLRSEKNRAENLMIVDLLRNDLGRIATPGSVQVPALFDLEAYPSVWTLTSSIQAEAPGASLADILRALFPCGSITGAPKLAAMQAIRSLEGRRRGIYCGSVGWLAPDGDFSLNVAIRTLELHGRRAQFGVGGGIVFDSDADQEWQECHWKARILNGWNAAGKPAP